MLTLQELKRIVDVPGFGVKLPTAKQLRASSSVIAQERLGLDSEISAYQSGYVLYQVEKYFTVFLLHSCRDYLYLADGKTVILPEQFFENREWYLRLVLEGEDRLNRNHEEKERSWNVSYSAVSEDWLAMENLTESMLEHLTRQETVAEICHSKILPAGRNTGADFKGIRHQPAGGIRNDFPGSPQHP